MTVLRTCLACGDDHIDGIADLGDAPVLTGALFPTRRRARQAVRGRLELAVCPRCGHVQNVAFDPGLVQYDVSYDNSLHFSGAFQQYADELVAQLVEGYDVRGKHVVEIGSGKGDFLAAISEAGGNTGTGYDPTVEPATTIPGVTLIQDYFRPGGHVDDYDLLVCRHVLEHLDEPVALLRSLAAAAPTRALYYFEVPAAEFNFGPDGLWDCIYPHVSYFSATSLASLLHRSGFTVISLRRSFHGQFLSVEARAITDDTRGISEPAPEQGEIAKHVALVKGFADRWSSTVRRWQDEVAALRHKGESLAVWGAGSKGVNFVNAVDPAGDIPVIDLNPRKAGRYLPGGGHQVQLPESLAGTNVSKVLITNPVYHDEIANKLTTMAVDAAVVTV